MANSTINGLPEATAVFSNDKFVLWSASANATRKVGVGPIAEAINRVNLRRSSNYTAIAFDIIAADTTFGAFTITLPSAPSQLDWVVISDIAQNWPQNNLTIARNGSLVNGLGENLVCDVSAEITLRYEGSAKGWRVFAYGY